MPRKFMFTREEIISAALALTRRGGMSALTARSLAAELGCSSRPIFGLFKNMEEVQREVIKAAGSLFRQRTDREMAKGKYPPYKAIGMAYIRFAREERELFKLLYMRDRTGENVSPDMEEVRPLLDLIRQKAGLDEEDAYLFHLEMWIHIHGIATMLATSYLQWDEDFIDRSVTEVFEAMTRYYREAKKR